MNTYENVGGGGGEGGTGGVRGGVGGAGGECGKGGEDGGGGAKQVETGPETPVRVVAQEQTVVWVGLET